MVRSYVKFYRQDWRILWFGLACAFLSSPGQTFFISMFVRPIADGLQVSDGRLGLLYLAATLGASSLLPLTGHWLDRIDLRYYFLGVISGLALACFVMASVSGTFSILVGLLLLRLGGQGLMTHIAVVSVARYFTDYRGRALSFVALGLPIAEAAMPQVALKLIAGVGWRSAYALIGAVILLFVAPILLWLIWRLPNFARPPARGAKSGTPRALDGMRLVVHTRFFWLALPILLFMPLVSTALIFHIRKISLLQGWPDFVVGVGFVGFAVAHGLGLFISGEFIDRFGARSIMSIMNVPFLLGICALGTLRHEGALPLFLTLAGLSSGLVQTTVIAIWAEVYGVDKLATVRSFATMLMVAATAVGPACVGAMLDEGISTMTISTVFIGLGIAATLLALTASKHLPKKP